MKFTKDNLREFAGFGLVGAANTVTYGLYAVLLFLFLIRYPTAWLCQLEFSYLITE